MNHRSDILAWNDEMAELVLDFGELPPAQRNSIRICLLHPRTRDLYVDRDQVVRESVAHLRAAWAAHPEDRELTDLIAELSAEVEDFARQWTRQPVKVGGRGRKLMRHPVAGLVSVDFEVLTPLQDPDQLLAIHRPSDERSRVALQRLWTDRLPRRRSGRRVCRAAHAVTGGLHRGRTTRPVAVSGRSEVAAAADRTAGVSPSWSASSAWSSSGRGRAASRPSRSSRARSAAGTAKACPTSAHSTIVGTNVAHTRSARERPFKPVVTTLFPAVREGPIFDRCDEDFCGTMKGAPKGVGWSRRVRRNLPARTLYYWPCACTGRSCAATGSSPSEPWCRPRWASRANSTSRRWRWARSWGSSRPAATPARVSCCRTCWPSVASCSSRSCCGASESTASTAPTGTGSSTCPRSPWTSCWARTRRSSTTTSPGRSPNGC